VALTVVSIAAFNTLDRQQNDSDKKIYHIILFSFLLLFAAFRDGHLLPDYNTYLKFFRVASENTRVEHSFYLIRSVVQYFFANGGGEYLLFFFYSLLGVGTKYLAIARYSTCPAFSYCIWISSFYILQDMIQIRASIPGGLLLFIMPLVQQRRFLYAIIAACVSFYFHNSAILLFILLFLDANHINKRFWTLSYMAILALNIFHVNVGYYITHFLLFVPSDFFGSRVALYLSANYAEVNKMTVSMFSPYILYQTLVCFITMHYAERLKEITPYAIMFIKTAFIGVFFYSLSIRGVSMRLGELFSTSLILLTPLLMYCVPACHKRLAAALVVLIAYLNLTYFIFVKHFIWDHMINMTLGC
jgi:hypothetical protein